jgi:hypothetical protein
VTRIPIDVTAPIACTASGDEIPVRIGQVEHLRDQLRSIDRTPDGLLLHFDPDADLQAHLERFVADEKRCCQFWGFEIRASAEELSLRWDGPPDVQTFLDELLRYFQSDEPLTARTGLL